MCRLQTARWKRALPGPALAESGAWLNAPTQKFFVRGEESADSPLRIKLPKPEWDRLPACQLFGGRSLELTTTKKAHRAGACATPLSLARGCARARGRN